MTGGMPITVLFLTALALLLYGAQAQGGCSVWVTNTPGSMFDGLYNNSGTYSSRPYYVAYLGLPAIRHYLYWNPLNVPGTASPYGWTIGLGLQLAPYVLYTQVNVATADQIGAVSLYWWWKPTASPATLFCCTRVACTAPASCSVKITQTPGYIFDGTYAYIGTYSSRPYYAAFLGSPALPYYLYWNPVIVPGMASPYGWTIGLGLQLAPYALYTQVDVPTADRIATVSWYWWWKPTASPATLWCCTITSCSSTGINCQGHYAWGNCTVSCGGGTQAGPWTVDVPQKFGGGCPQLGTSSSQACNSQACGAGSGHRTPLV